jgi:HK97 family phage portal protein
MKIQFPWGKSEKSMPMQGAMGFIGNITAPQPLSYDPLNLLKLNVGIVAACGTRNAQAVASARLRLFANKTPGRKLLNGVSHRSVTIKQLKSIISCKQFTDNEDAVEILEHPIIDLLSTVNGQMDYNTLAESTELYLGAVGTAYWALYGDPPNEIWLLPSEYVEALVNTSGVITGYRVYDPSGGVPETFPKERVIRFVNTCIGAFRGIGMKPTVGLYGIGSIEQCLPEANLLYEINRYETSLVENQAVPAHVVTYKGGTLDPERRRGLKKMWNAIFRGPGRAGKTEILDGDFDVKQLGLSPKDLAYETGKKWLRNVVANAHGVPEDLLSSENANRATASASYRSYLTLTIIPKLKRYIEVLNAQLCPLYDDNLFLVADNPTPLDEDFDLRKEQMEITTGIISINEARQKRGMALLDEDMRGSPSGKATADPVMDKEKDVDAENTNGGKR